MIRWTEDHRRTVLAKYYCMQLFSPPASSVLIVIYCSRLFVSFWTVPRNNLIWTCRVTGVEWQVLHVLPPTVEASLHLERDGYQDGYQAVQCLIRCGIRMRWFVGGCGMSWGGGAEGNKNGRKITLRIRGCLRRPPTCLHHLLLGVSNVVATTERIHRSSFLRARQQANWRKWKTTNTPSSAGTNRLKSPVVLAAMTVSAYINTSYIGLRRVPWV